MNDVYRKLLQEMKHGYIIYFEPERKIDKTTLCTKETKHPVIANDVKVQKKHCIKQCSLHEQGLHGIVC